MQSNGWLGRIYRGSTVVQKANLVNFTWKARNALIFYGKALDVQRLIFQVKNEEDYHITLESSTSTLLSLSSWGFLSYWVFFTKRF